MQFPNEHPQQPTPPRQAYQPFPPPGYNYPPQGPYAPPKKSRKVPWIVIAVALVAVVLTCGLLSKGVTSTASQSNIGSAGAPTLAPAAPTKTLLKTSGTGDTTTKAFTAQGTWTVQWSCTPSPDVSAAPLFINVLNGDGTPSDSGDISAMCKKGATSGSSDMPQGGTYRLKVIAGIDWSLKVVG